MNAWWYFIGVKEPPLKDTPLSVLDSSSAVWKLTSGRPLKISVLPHFPLTFDRKRSGFVRFLNAMEMSPHDLFQWNSDGFFWQVTYIYLCLILWEKDRLLCALRVGADVASPQGGLVCLFATFVRDWGEPGGTKQPDPSVNTEGYRPLGGFARAGHVGVPALTRRLWLLWRRCHNCSRPARLPVNHFFVFQAEGGRKMDENLKIQCYISIFSVYFVGHCALQNNV